MINSIESSNASSSSSFLAVVIAPSVVEHEPMSDHAGMLDEAIQSSSLMIAKLQDEHKAAMDAFVCPNCKVNNLLNVKHIHI